MAIIHATTMGPGKLELLKIWLPAQPWYLDRRREPELAKAGDSGSTIRRARSASSSWW